MTFLAFTGIVNFLTSIALGLFIIIKNPKSTINKIYIAYQVLIRAKNHVKRFLEIVNPKKWEFKKEEIGKELNSLGSSIKQALTSKYKRKDSFQF